MYCNDCGTGNTPDSKFCKECGGKFNTGYREMMLSVQDTHDVEDEASQERISNLLEMAFWHNENGNVEAAILACEAVLAINKNSTTAHSLLGSLYEKKGDDAKAIEHFEAVLALNPESAADAIKLDRLKRGVRVKAVAPPPAYKWLPPALVGVSIAGLREKWEGGRLADMRRPTLKPTPALLAGAAAALVLAIGLASIRPSVRPAATRVANVVAASPAVAAAPVGSRAGANSAFGGGAASASSSLSGGSAFVAAPPIPSSAVASARSSKVAPSAAALTGSDPFSDALKLYDTPLPPAARATAPPRLRAASSRSASRRSSGISAPPILPPLSLRAVPLGSDLAPAPVSVASASAVPLASVAAVPQHTVVVRDLDAGASGGNEGGGSGSHIKITVNSEGDAVTQITPLTESRSDEGRDGDAHQQTALGLQQQGDFRRARAAYQKAIRAYKNQLMAGRDAESARRGLAACQTGLQICQQSSP